MSPALVARATALTALFLATPNAALGQAICSAPHSAPDLARGGTIGTLAPGTGWAQIALHDQRSHQFFDAAGETRRFLSNGRFRASSVFLTGALGIVPGLEIWAQAPIHALAFEDESGRRERTGLGDARFALRLAPELFGVSGLPFAIRTGFKAPGSEFPVDATVIPLTEGQWDAELSLETGGTPFGSDVYVLAWAGYRWRGENREIARIPGNERFAHVAVGGRAANLRLELGLDLLHGNPNREQGLLLETSRRRLVQIVPTLGRSVGPGDVGIGAQIPVAGRNLPAGPSGRVSYLVAWGPR